jgi:hypothetical protein
MTMLKRLLALFTACCLAAPGAANAFGPEGHEIVARIADAALTAPTRARIDAILALEPGATLASISSWADQTRDKSTAAWHYVNMPRGSDCDYVAVRDCPGGDCVVEALHKQAERLHTASGADQLEALKFVVHFVGDLHQPLHAGYADDKGGNAYQLQAFEQGTNLHSLWDSAMIRAIDPSASSLSATLLSRSAPSASLAFAPEQWARESCLIVGRPDFYPANRTIGSDYLQTFEPVVTDRLYLAGLRLAATLNGILDPAGK